MEKKITLVGAGPGDIELITLKGIRAIKNADVILYDALANEEILEYAKPNVRLVYVGKRKGTYIYTQAEINKLIVDNALMYGNVVRLKGGDPFVFGRGFEEIEYAKNFNIECEVISGLTSAIAVPASIGIPVTSRGFADSFWVLTGTTKEGKISDDMLWAAHSSATIIILMGMSKLVEICKIFEKNGKGSTPMAIIQNGTRNNSRYVVGQVNEMVEMSATNKMTNPAVMVIGEVVGLHEDFAMNIEYIKNQYLGANK